MTRLFQIQHEPIAIIIVPAVFLVQLRQARQLVRRADILAVPVGDLIEPIRIDHRNLHQDNVVSNPARLLRLIRQHLVSQVRGLLYGSNFACMQT